MCGRYVTPTERELNAYWSQMPLSIYEPPDGVRIDTPFAQRFNVAPTTQVPIVLLENGVPVIRLARWGLVPVWWKEPRPPGFTFNARIEEAASKPMWKMPLKNSRCLVPALGWYEWMQVETVDPTTGEVKTAKQPYFIWPATQGIVHFAGLLSSRSGGQELSCSIMTRAAEGPAAEVHDRMPVVLPEAAFAAWLDPKQADGEQALTLAQSNAVTALQYHPVSSRVNQAKNEGAQLVAPIALRQ